MKHALFIFLTLAIGLTSAARAPAGTFTTGVLTGDANSGISSSNTYTHAINFNHDAVSTTINGVLFKAGSDGPQPSLNYDLQNVINGQDNFPNNLTGDIQTLASTFLNGGSDPESLTLTGLNDSSVYVATFYNVGDGNVGARYSDVTDGQGGHRLYDENESGTGNGSRLIDTYSPVGGSVTFTWTINTTDPSLDLNSTTTGNPFLFFGFSNQLLSQSVPEPGSVVLLALGLLSLAALMRSRRSGR